MKTHQVSKHDDADVVLFVGSGATAAVNKLVSALSLNKEAHSWKRSKNKYEWCSGSGQRRIEDRDICPRLMWRGDAVVYVGRSTLCDRS